MVIRRKRYGKKFKESILKKVMTGDKTLAELSREYGFAASSYYKWVQAYHRKAENYMEKKRLQKWTIAEKLEAIKDTASMTPEEKSAWCRKNGTYIQQIKKWENEIINGYGKESKESKKEKQKELNKLNAEIKSLKKDLNRKNSALAETTARLVLIKKWEAFLAEKEE
jgi:transposase